MLLTKHQKLFLLKLIKAKKHILFTPFDGVTVTFEKKRQSWQWILEQLRANGVNYNRDIMYLRYTTWSNLKRTTLAKVYSRKAKPNRKMFNEKDRLVFDIIGQEEVSRAFLKDKSLPHFPKQEPAIQLSPEPLEICETVPPKVSSPEDVTLMGFSFREQDQIQSCYPVQPELQVQSIDLPAPIEPSPSPKRHSLHYLPMMDNGESVPIRSSAFTPNTPITRPKILHSRSNSQPTSNCQNDYGLESAKTDYYRALAHKQKLEILQMELQMKLNPRYSKENGLIDYYSLSSNNCM